MFIKFSDSIINTDYIMLWFKHEQEGKFLVCGKPEGESYKAMSESYDTEKERDSRYSQIFNMLKQK